MKTRGLGPFIISGLLLTLAVSSLSVSAQDPLLQETEDILQNDQLDVDGTFTRKRKSAADKLAEMRRKLEERNEQMVQKKIEDVRIKEEMRLTKRLQDAFNSGLGALEEQKVSTVQAAPVVAPVPVVIAPAPKKKSHGVSVVPKLGFTNMSGDDIDFNSEFSGGIEIGGMVSSRISVGMIVNYSTMKIKDYNRNSFYNSSKPTDWRYGDLNWNASNTWYNNSYNQGARELNYKHLTLGANAKVYFSVDTKVRPYAGIGLFLNKASLKYSDSEERSYTLDPYGSYGASQMMYGDEKYSGTYVSASLSMGAEIMFTETVGMMVEGSFAKGLSSSSSKSEASFEYNRDQAQLDKIGKAIEDASFLSFGAGVVVSF